MSDERSLELSGSTDLTVLAGAINAEHRACEVAIKAGLAHAIKAGELLIRARALCPHGTWMAWVADHFEGSERLARSYMQAAREFPKLAAENGNGVADMSFREALAALAAPAGSVQETPHEERGEVRVHADLEQASPETRRAIFQELARDPAVVEDVADFGTDTGRALSELYQRTREIREQRRERDTQADPVLRKLEQQTAAVDIAGECNHYRRDTGRFVAAIEDLLPKVGTVEEGDLFWIREAVSDAQAALDRLSRLVDTGQTDLNTFLEGILGEHPDA